MMINDNMIMMMINYKSKLSIVVCVVVVVGLYYCVWRMGRRTAYTRGLGGKAERQCQALSDE